MDGLKAPGNWVPALFELARMGEGRPDISG
jgi:hypothetical protein